MEPKKFSKKVIGEAELQNKIILKLKSLDWSVRSTHGNMFQWGFPDLYAAHRQYGARWIEVKLPTRTGEVFTPAQLEYFHELQAKGIGIWVLTGYADEDIALLHKPANWWQYLYIMRKMR